MSSRVMVLGAGIYQLPLIKKARELGHYTIAVSIPGRYPGFAAADQICYTDTTDVAAVLEVARRERIDAIVTTGTDVALRSIAGVCAQLGLWGPGVEAAERCTDKVLMKEALLAGGARTGLGLRASSLAQARDACRKLGYPVMVKCVDQSGSRGITRVDAEDGLESAFGYALQAGKKPYVLVEAYIEGEEIGLDGCCVGGEVFVIAHGRVNHHNGHADVPIGHFLPCGLPPRVLKDVYRQATAAMRALGLDSCFVNMDIMLRDGKAYILEVGARTGATCIPEIISAHCGFDYYAAIIAAATGRPVHLDYAPGPACIGELLMAEQGGVLSSVQVPHPLPPGILGLSMDYAEGEKVPAFKVGPDRIGQIVATGSTLLKARLALDDTKNQMGLVVT